MPVGERRNIRDQRAEVSEARDVKEAKKWQKREEKRQRRGAEFAEKSEANYWEKKGMGERDSSTTRPDAPNCGAEATIGPLRSE